MLVNLISNVANNSFSVKYVGEEIPDSIIKLMAGLGPHSPVREREAISERGSCAKLSLMAAGNEELSSHMNNNEKKS